nr:hypothetical protein [Tanacetum cinerariifolium]
VRALVRAECHDAHQGPLPSVVFKEPDSGKFQPLLETPKKVSPAEQYIFQRRTPAPTEPSCHAKSPSIYAELGQVGSNPGDDAEPQPQSSHVIHARPNLKHMDLEATDVSNQQNPEQMHEGFGDQFFNDKPSKAENEKTTVKTKAKSMVSIIIYQDTSAIPSMRLLVIDLISRPDSPNDHRPLPTTTNVSKAVDEIVTDAVDWAIKAPLQNCFRDFPKADIKEILHQQMWETNSYKAQEDHMILYEALEKSMNRDHTDELLTNLAEARRKKKKRHDSPKTPHGIPPHQPPLPLPPAGLYGTSGSSGASGSSQLPPPSPPQSTSQSDQSKSTVASSSSKIVALAEYIAWTTTNIKIKPSVSLILEALHMDDDTAPDEQVHSSDDED